MGLSTIRRMKASRPSRAPQQQRSRETVARLLSATVRIIDEFGLEGAVIPRIAAAAKVSPASVYRRFADKDALLRAAFLHALRQSNEANQRHLAGLLLRDTLLETTKCLMILLFEQYRGHPQLVRALSRFVDANLDQEFIRDAQSIMAENLNDVLKILLAHRDEIAHPIPERALQIAILTALSAIEEFALEPTSLWHVLQPLSDEELANQLAHGCVAYLRTPQ